MHRRAPKATGSRARGAPKGRAEGKGNRAAAKPRPGGVRTDTNRVVRVVVSRGARNLGRSRVRGLRPPRGRTSLTMRTPSPTRAPGLRPPRARTSRSRSTRRRNRVPRARGRRARTNRVAGTPRPRRTLGDGNDRLRRAATTGVAEATKDRARNLGRSRVLRVRSASRRAGPPRSLRRAPFQSRRPLALRPSPVPRPSSVLPPSPALRPPVLRPSPVPPRRSRQPRRRRRQPHPLRKGRGHRDRPPRFAHIAAGGALPTRTAVQCGDSMRALGPSRGESQLPWRRSGSRPRARRRSRTRGERRGAPRGTVAPRRS
jgi:hypothetical protein